MELTTAMALFILLLFTTSLNFFTVNSMTFNTNNAVKFVQDLTISRVKRETLSESIQCFRTQGIIDDRLSRMDKSTRKSFSEEIEFTGDNKFSLQMAWTGNDTERIIVITSEDGMSTCYLSDVNGYKFNNISSRLGDVTTNYELVLQKHPLDSKAVYVVASSLSGSGSSLLHISLDAATTFKRIQLPFVAAESFAFHPSNPVLILAVDVQTQELYISQDKGFAWSKVKSDVVTYKWSTIRDSSDIYVVTGNEYFSIYTDSQNNVLEKSSDLGQTWKQLQDHVYTFGIGGKFLYASIYVSQSLSEERKLIVSTDGGLTWYHARLPTITPDRFYSILDSSEGQIFLHVDEPGNTGKGTLYLSDATGIIFSKSLENHLYPNYEDLTDFYPVQSMRGVYIASQLLADNSIRSVITYNRGSEWQPIKRPSGVPCADETKECHLHIHNLYSIKRGVKASPPLSVSNAVGIILVHGHVAESLQTTDPDVYVSCDGGYTWKFALKGPHHYQIADHGGLLVAVPADTETPSVIKFSTDEGGCWISYNFTEDNEPVQFTGLLVEPGNKRMTAAIWGYTTDRVWHTYLINFTVLIDRQCNVNTDYEDWVAHVHNGDEGCLLGNKETFKRLKQDSWCYNGDAYIVAKNNTPCLCTPDDYDCDYGYVRDEGTETCIADPEVKDKEIDICKRGHEEKFVPLGYHKIPGDICRGGFTPAQTEIVDLSLKCIADIEISHSGNNSKSLYVKENGVNEQRSTFIAIIAIFVLCGFIGVVILVVVYAQKFHRRQMLYHYMSIKADEDHGDNIVNSSLYEESSDEVMLH